MVSTTALAWLGAAINRTFVLPLVIFFPTSRCNSRCVSCDWWRSSGADDLALAEIDDVAEALEALDTKVVVFSGGEPLIRPDVFEAADAFRRRGMRLHLLTSGVGLGPRAADVARRFERVIVSLDAATDSVYARVRGIDGLGALERGVARLRAAAPALPVVARATLHQQNFRQLPLLLAKGQAMRLSELSFLAADVTSNAFGRGGSEGPRALLLNREEIREFRALVEAVVAEQAEAFTTAFIPGGAAGLRRLPQYYAAMLGDEPFPPRDCDAPWVSAVIEANGDVRPCFFHPPVGNLRRLPLPSLLRTHVRAFRTRLDVHADETCRRCVCSLEVNWRHAPWS